MPKPQPVQTTDEIYLTELFAILWKGKYLIFLITLVTIILSSVYLRNSVRTYSVEAVFKPVVEASGGPNLSGLSGLASLAGVSLPTSNSSDFLTYQKLLFSEEIAQRVFANAGLVIKLFKGEWNSELGLFEAPETGKISEIKQLVRSVVTGVEKRKYIPPNAKRLSLLMEKKLKLSMEGNGFLLISTETSKPDIMIKLILNASQETDDLLKERFFSTAEETLEFYYQKLVASRSPEHREALAKLISAEDQKLMLATNKTNFVAEPLTNPSVSLYPTSPKASLFLMLGAVLGLSIGVAVVLVGHAITKPRAE
ncbi:Wzz/FepE/Etk N-terminal domain-containing protein [Planktomarina sp.]|nr:Wzz/FepE/Etk N-terminal domain-containing protein [Planktomarina sp.]